MFQPDSFLIRFLTKTCDLLFLNIMFVLSCVTIIFSGAAVTSLYAVTLKMIRGQDYAPVKDFLRALRENFLPSFPAAILLLVDVTLLAILRAALYAETLLMPPTMFVLLSFAADLLTALLSWLFPLLARFENTFSRHLNNAVRLALVNLPVTFLSFRIPNQREEKKEIQPAGNQLGRYQPDIIRRILRFMEYNVQRAIRLLPETAARKLTANPSKPLRQRHRRNQQIEICQKFQPFYLRIKHRR